MAEDFFASGSHASDEALVLVVSAITNPCVRQTNVTLVSGAVKRTNLISRHFTFFGLNSHGPMT
jgi:hypothetical protein